MLPVTAHRSESSPQSLPSPVLHMSIELAEKRWKLAFTPGLGQRPRGRTVPARDLDAVMRECRDALARFRLPVDTRVVSCYEAGRDGFWLHRALLARGIANVVVDPASIEVNRRARRAKADRLDAEKLVASLVRATLGHLRVWRPVRVPTDADEASRHLAREIEAVLHDRTQVRNRIDSLLTLEGVDVDLARDGTAALAAARRWDGSPLPPAVVARVTRDWAQVQFLSTRLKELEATRRAELAEGETPAHEQMRQLARVRGVGIVSAVLLVREMFGWRAFRNRREVGGYVGLTATPFQTGGRHREQGISKAGNRRVRYVMIELAWGWLRHQPHSELTRWYQTRFAEGGPRQRRVGIVALARKLLIALWRYLDTGALPAGATVKA
jgi:transposase